MALAGGPMGGASGLGGGDLLTGSALSSTARRARAASCRSGAAAHSRASLPERARCRSTVWGVAGYGTVGSLLTPDSGPAQKSGLSMAMAAGWTPATCTIPNVGSPPIDAHRL